ncbi:ATP-dependent DNA helicase PIF1, partial [Cyphomyrmex costatus]
LINLIIKQNFFGEVAAFVYVIEFQKRGLPHRLTTIVRLPVHLPNEQNIIFENKTIEETMITALNQVTMLIDYFNLNSRDEEARQYLYIEIPRYYLFKKEKINGKDIARWVKRKSYYNCIGRMYSVSPTQIELFHLRLLLLTIKGATSSNDLKTVNGKICQSFSTCLALGLIEDDDEWIRAMNEAVGWMMPRQLRRLFVRILLHCQPLHPEQLWENFKVAMSEDYIRYLGLLEGQRKAYIQINIMLYAEGKSLADFPQMKQLIENNEENNYIILEEDMEVGNRQYEQLNNKQKEIVNFILNKLDTNDYSNNCIYIDGPGGSGKTFIYTTIYYLAKIRNKHICTMAFTGIAATLLPGGKTVHKTFKLPVPLFANSSSSIKIQSKEAHYLKETDIFILDEAPMAPRYALEIMDRTLRDIMNNDDLPFGGKIVILGGDFRQLLPIKIHGTQTEIVNLSIKFCSTWKYFINFSLTENMRVLPEEREFAKFLLDIGDSILNDCNDNIQLPNYCIASTDADIVQDIYGDIIRNKEFSKMEKCAILSARNIDVDEINKRVIELLDTFDERIYTSIDSTENCDNNEINEVLLPEYLNTLSPSCIPLYELRLKPNCVIMLIRNLSTNEGLCNGTRLMVIADHLLKCKILTGDKIGDIVFLNRITLYCENVYPFTFKRRQFPIKLAFAMTINKSQGRTFDKIGVDLRKDVFNHGQLYVTFSRVRSWEALKVYLGSQRDNKQIKNYVYKEIYK